MDLFTSVSVYLVLWWVVLFAVLPIGVKSHHEAGIEVPGGGEPASPVEPKILKKAITTTWVSAILFAIIWICFTYRLVHLPGLLGGALPH